MSRVIAIPQDLFDSTHFAVSPRRVYQAEPLLTPGNLFDLSQPPPRRPMLWPRRRADAVSRAEEHLERWDGLF
jgi:hypothetical protein